ncbi:MAG: hypothetical protein A3I07_04010 [Candidatus Doudnabacteria bacterium RIFCSPLOWO2_02_FULL_42_9]|uniref:Uncharacterized protein n=1 Tax=Candidatus Doudnabacteria bacterium RIFCSPHIGHO2_01_FULL_41_86 TaxID=1817821 RepID=A0A1F5N8C0_9BACT|nr:MAG: hypothetical protein A2717_04500 [Candidatus Doudnabacteria bacterium RIFCSPHIGHO2_01_FULL_41_86]OGE75873.1 MAG: hypothetical protein A3K07_04095 [Candidatus Doudnabacteria bacterium RIFCSPHIGHO2_01_43_10]OGE86247.1 MAG: hypothetical protein A3E28_03855 [Candidatus Doudnabacteria bacterium RIFCSPHIGHO2_12_FULL_42_22]OGE87095.1 MAG: hypothetical protein A3C49_03520 [Candidatus Doudnabacteria bacterium RIFCSPHIGHO2_02_FULL_42_25]OGE92235.1 MAG: hypothetical protein A2895_04205 [Candidatus
MPFFKTHPLRAKKRGDFELWCEALILIYEKKIKKEKYITEDHSRLMGIRSRMNSIKRTNTKQYKNSPVLI